MATKKKVAPKEVEPKVVTPKVTTPKATTKKQTHPVIMGKPVVVEPVVVKEDKGFELSPKNPSFPPIAQRWIVLKTVKTADLLPWAVRLGNKHEVIKRPEAIETIMRSEYGDKLFDEWAKKQKGVIDHG